MSFSDILRWLSLQFLYRLSAGWLLEQMMDLVYVLALALLLALVVGLAAGCGRLEPGRQTRTAGQPGHTHQGEQA